MCYEFQPMRGEKDNFVVPSEITLVKLSLREVTLSHQSNSPLLHFSPFGLV